MAQSEISKQFSFRLPEELVEQVENCADSLRAQGLEVTRADVVRLLLKHALRATHGAGWSFFCDQQGRNGAGVGTNDPRP